ncbi:hypothetical protein QE152_g40946 [Popillia japonica]|uniref:Uncharacterized protein n=1 Tax=Popillia japonica TaxID=7064 RepID=A0AAW1HF21_POPJA
MSAGKLQSKTSVDWEAFKDTILIVAPGKDDTSHTRCTHLIQQALKNSTHTRTTTRGAPYWWDESIAETRRKCVEARRKFTRAARRKGDDNAEATVKKQEYRELKKSVGKQIAEAKKRSWATLCQELENDIWGGAYKIVAKKVGGLGQKEVHPRS